MQPTATKLILVTAGAIFIWLGSITYQFGWIALATVVWVAARLVKTA